MRVDSRERKSERHPLSVPQLSTINYQLKMAARVGLAPTPNGLTGRRAAFTPPGNGAAGRVPTCIVPFRRRMSHVFSHGSDLKLVSAVGFAPAVTRSQAGHVAATPRAGRPGDPKDTGDLFHGEGGTHTLNLSPAVRFGNWRTRRELHPGGRAQAPLPQTTGRSAD